MSTNERRNIANEYVAINRRFEKYWFPKVKKAIDSKISSLIVKIKDDGLQAGIRYLRLDIGNSRLAETIENMYIAVGLRHARRTERRLRAEIQKSSSLNMEIKRMGNAQAWIEFIKNYLRLFLIEKITFSVNETTRDKLLAVMNEAIEKGWGVDETVKHLMELPFTAYQAARIVRTEINRAANAGVQAQGEKFEYELKKEWISVHDNRTRGADPKDHADHLHMDEQTVDFYDVFRDPRNGHELRHPGDPKAAAEDTINCRCNFTTKPKRDKNGRLIPKKSRVTVIRNFNTNTRTITI